MGADVEVRVADARAFDEREAYDRVLVDPPCSDLGTLALRPDARWRKQPGDPERLAALQREILDAGARALRSRAASLVYSTCTISPAENEGQLAGSASTRTRLARHGPTSPSGTIRAWPA